MTSIVRKLHADGLIKPPPFVVGGVQMEVITGSEAYGMTSGDSDRDIYGWCFPPKDMVFPHLSGEIHGFGVQKQRFEQFSQHHIDVPDRGMQYDITIYGIVKYFQLVMENNPNMIDSLFVPQRCVVYSTPVADYVRTNRKVFLHKGAWHKFKGYAYSQMKKIRVVDSNSREGKRKELIEKFGFDVKFASHLVRLMCEVEQILTEGDLDLERNSEQLKSIRRGEWTLKQVEDFFATKELSLEKVYNESKLPWGQPDIEPQVKAILLHCLESYYGDLSKAVVATGVAEDTLRNIKALIERAGI